MIDFHSCWLQAVSPDLEAARATLAAAQQQDLDAIRLPTVLIMSSHDCAGCVARSGGSACSTGSCAAAAPRCNKTVN